MAATVSGVLLTGVHGSRPSSGVSVGTLYACSTHSLIYQTSDTGSTWATWASLTGTVTTTMATDTLWDAKGDVAGGTGANTGARLAVGSNGQVLTADSTQSTGLKWAAAAAASSELDYVAYTSAVNITETSEGGTPNTIVTGSAVAYDGATAVIIEFYCPDWYNSAGGVDLVLLYDGASSIGRLGHVNGLPTVAGDRRVPLHCMTRLTPSAATHTYSIRGISAGGTAQADAGAGGASTTRPGFIRITRA